MEVMMVVIVTMVFRTDVESVEWKWILQKYISYASNHIIRQSIFTGDPKNENSMDIWLHFIYIKRKVKLEYFDHSDLSEGSKLFLNDHQNYRNTYAGSKLYSLLHYYAYKHTYMYTYISIQ